MIGGFRSGLCVSVFQGPLLVIVIMTDDSGKRNCEDYRVYSHDTTVAILKSVLHVQFVFFLLISSISLEAIFIVVPV